MRWVRGFMEKSTGTPSTTSRKEHFVWKQTRSASMWLTSRRKQCFQSRMLSAVSSLLGYLRLKRCRHRRPSSPKEAQKRPPRERRAASSGDRSSNTSMSKRWGMRARAGAARTAKGAAGAVGATAALASTLCLARSAATRASRRDNATPAERFAARSCSRSARLAAAASALAASEGSVAALGASCVEASLGACEHAVPPNREAVVETSSSASSPSLRCSPSAVLQEAAGPNGRATGSHSCTARRAARLCARRAFRSCAALSSSSGFFARMPQLIHTCDPAANAGAAEGWLTSFSSLRRRLAFRRRTSLQGSSSGPWLATRASPAVFAPAAHGTPAPVRGAALAGGGGAGTPGRADPCPRGWRSGRMGRATTFDLEALKSSALGNSGLTQPGRCPQGHV
mmetsp:Transcript_45654/g.145726  ORF Transcript_45654/g.145726 Transcript_45654/m.145726 type:complete len:398 (+) Transcript_45654:1569-2762(+)